MTKKIELFVFDEENVEILRRINDMLNDIDVMMNRGELNREVTSKFIQYLRDDFDTRVSLGYFYMNEHKIMKED